MWVKTCVILAIFLPFSSTAVRAEAEQENYQAIDAYEVGDMSPEKAFATGRLLRAQYKNMESRPYLKYAADSDNPDAAFLYAMELSNYKTTIRTPPEAREYLLKAAELGNRRAMKHLYTDAKWLRDRDVQYWKSQYYDSLIRLGRDEPAQATYELAQFYKGMDNEMYSHYLDKAVSFNHPRALMDKAKQVQAGSGLFLMPGERETKVRELYLAAAKTNYIPAMRFYIDILESKGRFKEAYQWRLMALEQGDITSLATIIKILLGDSASYQFVIQDRIKAKAYLDLYLTYAGTERMQSLYSTLQLEEESLAGKMSDEEKLQANDIFINYKNNLNFYYHDVFWDIN
ncbi:sel1 repeat family protein [Vibrio qinghaiensis]|nr:sel1 repeat family protein [Vibrio qinghaiensis]